MPNPLDIPPSTDDKAHAYATDVLAQDRGVDAIVIGLDSLPATHSLRPSTNPNFDLDADTGMAKLLRDVANRSEKPIVGVIDGGRLYEAYRDAVRSAGLVVFPVCDRAVAALSLYIEARLYADSIRAAHGVH